MAHVGATLNPPGSATHAAIIAMFTMVVAVSVIKGKAVALKYVPSNGLGPELGSSRYRLIGPLPLVVIGPVITMQFSSKMRVLSKGDEGRKNKTMS